MVSNWSIDLGPILHYGVYVLLGIVCLGAIVRALWAPMDIHRAPCCGGCGHGVRDILQGICPECGGQYAKVGITTPSMAVRLRASLPIALLAWTTLIGLGATISHGWLEQRAWASFSSSSVAFTPGMGGKQQESLTAELTPMYVYVISPDSRTEDGYRIGLALNYVIDGDKVESGTCVLKLHKNGESQSVPLTIDLSDGTFSIKDDKGKEIVKGGKEENVDAAAVEKWFKEVGINTELNGTKRSMQDAVKIARYARSDPGAIESTLNMGFTSNDIGALRSNGTSTRSSGGVPTSFSTSPAMIGPPGIGAKEMSLWVGLLGLVYIAGCAGLVWRNRRVIRG